MSLGKWELLLMRFDSKFVAKNELNKQIMISGHRENGH